MARKLLREPLVHFLLLGLVLFAWFDWRGGVGSSRIVVTAGQIEHLASAFARTRQRPPTDEELKALVDDHVRDELAAREAAAAGLDRDDPVVRRRLRQKLEFLVEDALDQSPPAEAELRGWLAAHRDDFRTEPRIALRQVFVSRALRGAGAAREAERILARLRAAGPAADTSRLGDATALPTELALGPLREVNLTFGDAFARAVDALPEGAWDGPVESAYGLHLVLVRERIASTQPDLASVRPQVEREVIQDRRRRELDALYERLLARYPVTVERPAPKDAPVAGAGR
jgi:hypothetical protein